MSKQVQEFAVDVRGGHEMDIDQLLLKLERNQATVQRITTRLSSYRMEPTNAECFERLADLRMGFRDLARDQVLLLGLLKNSKVHIEDQWSKVMNLFGRYQELQEDLASYLLLSRGY